MEGVGKPACVDCFRPDVTARPKESEKVSIMTSNRIGRYLPRKRNLGFLFLYVLQKSLCGPKVRPAQALTTVFGKGFFLLWSDLVSFSCSQHQPKIQLLSCPERVTQDNRFGFSAPLSRKLVLDSNSLTDLPLSTNQ